jgi:hypothetical protein
VSVEKSFSENDFALALGAEAAQTIRVTPRTADHNAKTDYSKHESRMKLGLGLYRHMLTRDNFQFARQAGATHLVVHSGGLLQRGRA